MNYWQFKIPMSVWERNWTDEFNELKVGGKFKHQIKSVHKKIDNSIGDIVFYYNAKAVKSKNFYEGVYLVCKIASNVLDDSLDKFIELEVIKDLRETPYKYDIDFSDLHIYHNTVQLRGRAQTYELLDITRCDIEDFYQTILHYKSDGTYILDDIKKIRNKKGISITEKENLIKCRLGQGTFRRDLIVQWDGRCSVTGYNKKSILVASHIKPWKDADNNERLDSYNGLLLIPTLDKLFDKGYISFDDNGKILISNELDNYEVLGVTKKLSIDVHSRHKKYLKYHRENVFQA